MNFLDKERKSLKSISIIKFTGHTNFMIDSDAIRHNINGDPDTNKFKVRGVIVDLETGRRFNETLTLLFNGFYRNSVTGELEVPEGFSAKEYSKYVKHKPYALEFYYENFEAEYG